MSVSTPYIEHSVPLRQAPIRVLAMAVRVTAFGTRIPKTGQSYPVKWSVLILSD